MAAAIRTCIGTGQLKSNTASNTADFIEFIDHLFDCLNSRSLYSRNPYSCALTDSGIVKSFLTDASQYFKNLYKLKAGKLTQPPCIKGFTQINGVFQFFEKEKAHNIVFLLTNRLNQDVLKNLLSIFRQHGGYNKNPTVRTIRTSIRSNCIFSLYASKGANCEAIQEVEESIILSEDVTQIDKCNSKSDSDTKCDSNLSISSSKNPIESPNQNKVGFTLEDCSVTYFAGYLGYRVIKKFGCNQCKNELLLEGETLNI